MTGFFTVLIVLIAVLFWAAPRGYGRYVAILIILERGYSLYPHLHIPQYWESFLFANSLAILLVALGLILRSNSSKSFSLYFSAIASGTESLAEEDRVRLCRFTDSFKTSLWKSAITIGFINCLAFLSGRLLNTNSLIFQYRPNDETVAFFLPFIGLLIFTQFLLKIPTFGWFKTPLENSPQNSHSDFPELIWLLPFLGLFLLESAEISNYLSQLF
jgi:hypothetical protein